MSLSPPKLGNPPLPWGLLPWWLRSLRVLFFSAWGGAVLCLATIFSLQTQVLTSPRLQTGVFVHPVVFKGATFYLSDLFFGVWTALNLASEPLWAVGFLLMIAISVFEYRIKQRRWDTWLAEVSERQNADGQRGAG